MPAARAKHPPSPAGKLHPLWRKNLQNALRENQTLPNCRFVQLSTLRVNGTPASRNIVFRGFLEDPKGDPSSTLWFVGDLRTEKAEQARKGRLQLRHISINLLLLLTSPCLRCGIPTAAS